MYHRRTIVVINKDKLLKYSFCVVILSYSRFESVNQAYILVQTNNKIISHKSLFASHSFQL